jgi:hypothetical protein
LAHEGTGERDKEGTVELLALAFHHPASPRGLLEKWLLFIRLRAELEAELGPEIYAAAWERGRALDFQAALTELMDQFRVT